MRYEDGTAEGRDRLRRWLPIARKMLAESPVKHNLMSAGSRAMIPFINEDNLASVELQTNGAGLWHCSILLKAVPHGVANSMSNPHGTPLKTRLDAEEHGLATLCLCLTLSDENREHPRQTVDPVFDLHGYNVTLKVESIENFAAAMDGTGFNRSDVVDALTRRMPRRGRVERTLKGPDAPRVLALLYGAAAFGIMRWPLHEDGP